MNRESDFDQTLRSWLDDGADRAPERFVWAALEDAAKTNQRGAWVALLEGTIMKLKPAAPILGVAAVIVLAIAMYQVLGGNVGGPEQTPTPSPRTFSAEDLPRIVASEDDPPNGMSYARSESGAIALVVELRPGGPSIDQRAFVDALANYFDATDVADGYGGYVSWSALFETEADAEVAYDFIVTEHESPDGWDLQPDATSPGLGDESVSYTGPAYDWTASRVILWRVDNLVLAAVGVENYDAALVQSVADAMSDRAN
jgi:hypothetical protein